MPVQRGKLLDRKVNVRDARLFVIATEGEKTEKQYFEGFNSPRIKVEILSAGEDGHSAPAQTLERLRNFRKQFDLGRDDELWVVVDVDRIGDIRLDAMCKDALRSKFRVAVSNPCFEFWLLLHFQENDLPNPEWETLLAQSRNTPKARDNPSKAMEAYLRARLSDTGGYQNNNVKPERFRPGVTAAIARARNLHTNPSERWPRQFPGTHVYLLIERLLASLTPQSM